MAKEGGYEVKDLYQGGYSNFDPNKGNMSTAGSMGLTTDPRSANIVKEVGHKLSSGVSHMEVVLISPDMIDAIPKQQFDEVRQLAKATGISLSVHGPVMNATGINSQQGGYSEINRVHAEDRIMDTLLKSQQLDPDGNINVVFHTSEGLVGSEWETLDTKEKRTAKRLGVVNKESGQMSVLEKEEMFVPSHEIRPDAKKIEEFNKGKISREEIAKEFKTGGFTVQELTPEHRIGSQNRTSWDDSLNQVIFNKERADEILENNAPIIQKYLELEAKGEVDQRVLAADPILKKAHDHFVNANTYIEDTDLKVKSLFSKAYKYGTDKQKEHLKKLSESYSNMLGQNPQDPVHQSNALQYLIHQMKTPELAPEIMVSADDFALEEGAKTFGNAAFRAFDKLGRDVKKAPVVAIENPPAGFTLSTGEDLANLVVESRKVFEEKAVENGMSLNEAQKTSERLIGATWDVGHINMLRKQGFTEEDIVKESEKVAPYLKHIHLSDNFGMEHTELPMGMGNVPMKAIMEKLGEKGFEAKKVIEASSWWQHFQSAPVAESFEGLGAPMYTSGTGPTWAQRTGLYQGYSSGMEGAWMPQINYETFGTAFSQLPAELGGQRPGAGGRMGGRPME